MHGHSLNSPARLAIRPRRALSQSFLQDERVAAAIVRAARIEPTDSVLEIGPGLGVLTRRLVQQARHLIAVEIDARLAEQLRTELSAPNLTLCTADVLQTDIKSLFDGPFVVVANLPYHITSPALRHLLQAEPTRMVVMVQREVGDRIAASPGDMSALSVLIQAQARVEVVRYVPKTAFYPRPKVDSVVLRLTRLEDQSIATSEFDAFTDLVHAGFKQPRKQLGNSLAEGLQVEKPAAVALLQSAQIDPARRPQELTLQDWLRLFDVRRPA